MLLESLRTLLAIAASRDYDIIQFNVTSAHFHGMLKEGPYMEQPDGYAVPGTEKWVWRLKKGLYGLVQAGRTWNEGPNDHIWGGRYPATAKDSQSISRTPGTRQISRPEVFGLTNFVGIGCSEGTRRTGKDC